MVFSFAMDHGLWTMVRYKYRTQSGFHLSLQKFLAMVISKTPSQSATIMNELVLPNDTNTLNNLMGGRLLHWMDIVAAIAGQKHSNRTVVTASVDSVSFNQGIGLGDVVTLTSYVTRAFNTSMEVFIEVWCENIPKGTRFKCNEAYYTFV